MDLCSINITRTLDSKEKSKKGDILKGVVKPRSLYNQTSEKDLGSVLVQGRRPYSISGAPTILGHKLFH